MKNIELTREEIEKRVYEIIFQIASNSGLQIKVIDPKTDIFHDLGFDSVALIELLVEIENEFDIEVDEDDMDINRLIVISQLIDVIDERIS